MRVDYKNKQYDTHRWPIKEEKQELDIVETGSDLIKWSTLWSARSYQLSFQPSRIKTEGKNTSFVVSRNARITQDSQILSWFVLKETFLNFLLPKTPLQNITRVLFLGKVSGWQADYQGLVFYSTICSHFCQQTAKNRLLSHQSMRRKLALIHFALLFSCSAQWTQTKKKEKELDGQSKLTMRRQHKCSHINVITEYRRLTTHHNNWQQQAALWQ